MQVRIKDNLNGSYNFNWGEGWQEWNINDLTEWAVENNPMLHLFLMGDLPLEVSKINKDELIFRLEGGVH